MQVSVFPLSTPLPSLGEDGIWDMGHTPEGLESIRADLFVHTTRASIQGHQLRSDASPMLRAVLHSPSPSVSAVEHTERALYLLLDLSITTALAP